MIVALLLFALSLSHAGCFLDEKLERYYGRVVVPRDQQFTWSDGGLPQTFDPAFAAAPPDTDVVRALFEGLTDYDPQSLAPIPAVATHWESSEGGKTWTFYLRDDARWSNGELVTASDFVRSWRRTMRIGDLAPHTELLKNIEGARTDSVPATATRTAAAGQRQPVPPQPSFGVQAVSDLVLRVRLRQPDMNFPALVAHPVFRPVKVNDDTTTTRVTPESLISNGAFALAKAESTRVLLERANNYWNKDQIALHLVSFVDAKDTESALAAYRAGEVDAVTNANFEALAVKLLTPYEDFHRTTYGALTYYTFNSTRSPFDDVRVREALAIGIDRDRISADEMNGATEPAKQFLPTTTARPQEPVVNKSEVVEKEYERARALLADAGYPDGNGFPRVRLLINRNDQQRIVAQAVANMWRTVLNIETEIIVKSWDEYEAAIRAGEYDVVRRGLVMQTTDELTNIRMLFPERNEPATEPSPTVANGSPEAQNGNTVRVTSVAETEAQALKNLKAMPIYFASSYSLVKPYVKGFDANVLDAPSLKTLRIDTGWRPEGSPGGR